MKEDATNPLFRSKELRWFFKEKNALLENWFNLNGLFFEKQDERRDFYLDLHPLENMSYKIREGKTEIKVHVEGSSSPFSLGGHRGHAQNWIKWSLDLKKDLTTPQQIYERAKGKFIEVIKKRLLIKYEVDSDGEISKTEGDYTPAEGGQVEFTKLEIKKETWYSLAFEAFGSEKLIDRNFDRLTQKIFGEISNIRMEEKDSFSYPVFLRIMRR